MHFLLNLKLKFLWTLCLFSILLSACDGETNPSANITLGSNSSVTPGTSPGVSLSTKPATRAITLGATLTPVTTAISNNILPTVALTPTPALVMGPTQALPAPTDGTTNPDSLYMGETGHFIKAPFLAYWQKYGGQSVFGAPLSEPYIQNGIQVQLFEQALLEYHPERAGQNDEISLGFLGRELAQAQDLPGSNPAFAPVSEKDQSAAEDFIPQTSHTLIEPFKSFWSDNKLVKFLGYPISQTFEQDGLTVQYFERGRLEYNPIIKAVKYTNSGDLLIAAAGWPAPQKFDLYLILPPDLKTTQGQTFVVQFSNAAGWQPADLRGKFATSSLKFASIKPAGLTAPVLRAYQAVDPALTPQTYPLTLNFTDKNGVARTISRSISVAAHDYGAQDLSLQGSLENLADHSADDYDNDKLAAAYATFTPDLLWKGLWQWPLQVPWTQTTDFAQRRVFNGKLDTLYYHGGIDLAPDSGADGANVHTGAAGTVIFTGSLQARGLSVAVNHGLGITSYYFHLAQINVKVGQTLQDGEVLGLVGSTGRATGPHLDWEVRVNGIITDPRNFLQRDFSQ